MNKKLGTVVPNTDLKPPPGSCNMSPVDQPPAQHPVKTPDQIEAEKLGVTVGKLLAMRHYAILLRRQDPKIKMSTVRSKVLKKFNIKLS